MMLMWYDDSKKSTTQKITEGCAAYRARFGARPTVVLVNERENVVIEGLEIRPLARIEVNNFHIGAGASDAPPR